VNSDYDFVVAGGGPSGLQFAREVTSRTDYSVAVLEANDRIADNDKSSGGTFHQVVEAYDVADGAVMAETDEVVFEGPSATSRLPIPGYVLDFPGFLEFLSEDAQREGAEVHTGTRVLEPLRENGRVGGVRYHDGSDEGVVRAEVVVDATGPAAALTEPLGMFDPDGAQYGIGKEYVVEGTYDVEEMLLCFDQAVAPGGYTWLFPAGDDAFKAGICWVTELFEEHAPDDGRTIDDYLDEWLRGDDRWQEASIRAVHAGEVYSNNSINRRATDGLVAVGDAVSSINPLFGEGIRPAMQSGEMAAAVAIEALRDGATTRDRLETYERRWNERKGADWKVQRIVGELLYGFEPDRQDRFVRATDGLTDAQLERLQRLEPSLRDLLSLYPFGARDVRKLPSLLGHLTANER